MTTLVYTGYNGWKENSSGILQATKQLVSFKCSGVLPLVVMHEPWFAGKAMHKCLLVPYFSLFFTQELAISFGHQTYTASHVNHDTSQLGISPSESWKFSRIPCWLWQCLYKIVIYYSHPQIDGKVNHHWFSRVLQKHLFGVTIMFLSMISMYV